MRDRVSTATTLAACAIVTAVALGLAAQQAPSLPSALSDTEFRRLITDFAEPGGMFHSDNFTSNEPGFALAAAELAARRPGGAYLGVGAEQNFSYIVAVRPEIAFIVDIRRQAVIQHLLFKALFELSDDRAEFLARLFSVPRPGVARDAPIEVIWKSIPRGPGSDRERYARNLVDVQAQMKTRGLELDAGDTAALEYVYKAFFTLGPAIDYGGFQEKLSTGNTDFAALSQAVDDKGVPRSFLAADASFQTVKAMQQRNLIVPVQGDFAGPKTLRAIGDYLRAHGTAVNVFYISNVEQYLFGGTPTRFKDIDVNGGWQNFYRNLAALPADASTALLRIASLGASRANVRRRSALCPLLPFLAAVDAGRVTSQSQAVACQVVEKHPPPPSPRGMADSMRGGHGENPRFSPTSQTLLTER
jgi:hypothetical protein